MKNIDNSFRDTHISPLSNSETKLNVKKGTEANQLYDKLKKGTLNLRIPERFNVPKIIKKTKHAMTKKKQLTMAFEHRRPCLNTQLNTLSNNKNVNITPDVLTMNKMKVPTGYQATKAILRYEITIETKETEINFKIGNTCKSIKPFLENDTISLQKIKQDTFKGKLEIDLENVILDSQSVSKTMTENNEIPFSVFIKESKQHLFQVLIACEPLKSTSKNWPLKTYHQLKNRYNEQQESYDLKFKEQQQQNEHSLFDMI